MPRPRSRYERGAWRRCGRCGAAAPGAGRRRKAARKPSPRRRLPQESLQRSAPSVTRLPPHLWLTSPTQVNVDRLSPVPSPAICGGGVRTEKTLCPGVCMRDGGGQPKPPKPLRGGCMRVCRGCVACGCAVAPRTSTTEHRAREWTTSAKVTSAGKISISPAQERTWGLRTCDRNQVARNLACGVTKQNPKNDGTPASESVRGSHSSAHASARGRSSCATALAAIWNPQGELKSATGEERSVNAREASAASSPIPAAVRGTLSVSSVGGRLGARQPRGRACNEYPGSTRVEALPEDREVGTRELSPPRAASSRGTQRCRRRPHSCRGGLR